MDLAQLVAVEASEACKGEPDIIERIKKAMVASRDHWMATNEVDQFRGAVAAAILASEGDERDRIQRSAESLKRAAAMLQALTSGVPVDFEKMAEQKEDDDIIPLRKLWTETAPR